MKWIALALFSGFSTMTMAQIEVNVSGNIFNLEADSIYLSKMSGDKLMDIKGAKFKKNGDFSIKTKVDNADFYVLRFDNSQINLILVFITHCLSIFYRHSLCYCFYN